MFLQCNAIKQQCICLISHDLQRAEKAVGSASMAIFVMIRWLFVTLVWPVQFVLHLSKFQPNNNQIHTLHLLIEARIDFGTTKVKHVHILKVQRKV